MSRGRKRANDALLRNSRQTRQARLDVPYTTAGRGRHMAQERELLAKRRMLEEQAKNKRWELEAIFQMIHDTDMKIEEQREKQTIKEREREE